MTVDFEVRPWGSWRVVEQGDGYKVKRIVVKPHHRLSYQTHVHRSEHWVVVTGTATCLIEGRTTVVRAGESIDVGVGQAHRIANDHDDELVIIEVQRGPYLGEDDIVRLQDDYGRELAGGARRRSATP
jgi:mannose-6-phosphate isomerase-like protein (cupin superfamily)